MKILVLLSFAMVCLDGGIQVHVGAVPQEAVGCDAISAEDKVRDFSASIVYDVVNFFLYIYFLVNPPFLGFLLRFY